MRSSLLIVLALATLSCGPYRVVYEMPPNERVTPTYVERRQHAHGLGGPGGGYFFLTNPMLPAWVDYTGPVRVESVCPHGFSEVSHGFRFWQQATAAGISWIAVLNWWHPSTVTWTCRAQPLHDRAPK